MIAGEVRELTLRMVLFGVPAFLVVWCAFGVLTYVRQRRRWR